jgi:hypothetical protein
MPKRLSPSMGRAAPHRDRPTLVTSCIRNGLVHIDVEKSSSHHLSQGETGKAHKHRTNPGLSRRKLDASEQLGQAFPQPFGNLLDIEQRHVPNPSLDSAVVSPMQSAPFRSFLLVDPLRLAYAADCAAKTDADIDGHRAR